MSDPDNDSNTVHDDSEERQLQTVALQTAQSILLARRRAEEELRRAREALESKNQELLQQREWYEVTLASIGDAVITTDIYGHITFMNPVAQMLTGWSLAEAMGLALDKVFHIIDELTGQPAANPVVEALREGRIVSLGSHSVLITRAGASIAIEDSAAPIRDVRGKTIGAVMVFHDVVDKRRAVAALQEESEALETLNRTGAAIAAQLDIEETVKTVTDAATQLSGAEFGAFFYTRRDADGNVLALYSLSGAERERFAALGHPRATPLFGLTVEGKPPVRIDDVLSDPRYGHWAPHHGMPDGHPPVRSYLAVPVVSRTGEVFGGLFFGHSQPGIFTERAERMVSGIASHAAIAIDNARLYEEAQREIANRQKAEEALRTTDRLKDEFLALLAHELRNPLAPIRQAASIWNQDDVTPEQLQWSHKVVERQSRHMSVLLDDLLDISRIKRGQLRLRKEWTDFTSVVDAAIETANPLIRTRQHELTVDLARTSLYLAADPLRLTQVLANLLNNAAKYTRPHGRIMLSACIENDELVVVVADTGIGIDKKLQPQVFEIFFQSTPAIDRIEGGLGLGLALVKGIVSLHGGTIEVNSEGLDQGTQFTLRIPVGREPDETVSTTLRPTPATAAHAGTKPAARRILIADDNRDMADSLALYLQLRGHTVTTVYSGEAAIEALAPSPPDIVVLDIGMPGLNGYDTARKIRAMSEGRKLFMVALTGWGQESDRKQALDAGFDHHCTKPINPAHLAHIVERQTAI